MDIIKDTLNVKTDKRLEIVDITQDINDLLRNNQIKRGLINVFAKHATAGITINENESRLIKDFENTIESLIPAGAGYQHDVIDNNADSHIKTFLIGSSEIIPIENGSLELGTWQRVFLVETDGPRNRRIIITITGE